MLPDPKGMANPVPRDADYPIPTVVGRVRYRGYGCPKEVLSDVVWLRAVARATTAVRCRVGTANSVMGSVGIVGSHTSHNTYHLELLHLGLRPEYQYIEITFYLNNTLKCFLF